MASSHAFAVVEPERWDELRERNRKAYAQRYGHEPPIHPRVREESWEDIVTRYGRVRRGLVALQTVLKETKPDVLLVIGDDQNENYTAQNVPQIAIYTGEEALFFDRLNREERRYPCDANTAKIILEAS